MCKALALPGEPAGRDRYAQSRAEVVDVVLALTRVALVDRRFCSLAAPFQRERLAIRPADEGAGIRRLRPGGVNAGAVLRHLVAVDLGDEAQHALASLLPTFVKLRTLAWRFRGVERIGLPRTVERLMLTTHAASANALEFAAIPTRFRELIAIGLFVGAAASFASLTRIRFTTDTEAESVTMRANISAATGVRSLGITAFTVELVALALGASLTPTHPHLEHFRLNLRHEAEPVRLDPVLALLPDHLQFFDFDIFIDDHATLVAFQTALVETFEASWISDAERGVPALLPQLLEIGPQLILPCGEGCAAVPLGRRLREACEVRSRARPGPPVTVEATDE